MYGRDERGKNRMRHLRYLWIELKPTEVGGDLMEFRCEAYVALDGKDRKYGFTHLLPSNHFSSVWEDLMKQATKEIGIAVKEAE